MNPLVMMLAFGGRALGGGIIKKVLMYTILGPMGLLLGGRMNFKDFILVPAIAPYLKGIIGI